MMPPAFNRRKFIGAVASLAAAAPFFRKPDLFAAVTKEPSPTPEESLRRLVLVLGPWKRKERKKAEEFAARFVRSKHNSAQYLSGSKEQLVSLAKHFPDDAIAVEKVELDGLPAKEKELLLGLTGQIYSLVEVRFGLIGEPPQGSCLPDRMVYTKKPA